MPFLDDTGIREEVDRGPLWSAFATFGGQLERMIALNVLWALQLAPAVLAMLLINAPDLIRLLLILYTAAAIPPATMILYALLRRATEGDPVDFGLIRELLGQLLVPSYRAFAPLLGFLGFVLWSINTANEANLFLVSVLLQLAFLLLLTSAHYWGALLVEHPDWSAPAVIGRSFRLVWRSPGRSLLVSGVVLLAMVLGAISVGGLVLAVPVIIVLLQTQMFLALSRKQRSIESDRKG
ncbi:MAG: hypothetical protein ABI835_17490 [Chloroflexota bacterium]